MSESEPRGPVVVIGGGTMGHAIVEGCVSSGAMRAGDFFVVEPDAGRRASFEAMGVATMASLDGLAGDLDDSAQVLLAIKPQSLAQAAPGMVDLARGRVVISILAGTPTPAIGRLLPGARVVRAMPNTPARVRRGTTALCLGHGAQAGDDALARRMFEAIGRCITIDETLMDGFTAVAGSGPAYVFYLAQALVEGAIRVGFDPDDARRIVRSVIDGSAVLLDSPSEVGGEPMPPEDLRTAVTSKGGTTEAACRLLDERGVKASIADAVVAARDRGVALGSPNRET